MDIRVLEIRIIGGNGKPVKGFVDVSLGPVVIRDFRILDNGQRPYVRFPCVAYRKDGGRLFRPLIDVPADLKPEIDSAILNQYFALRKKEKERVRRCN